MPLTSLSLSLSLSLNSVIIRVPIVLIQIPDRVLLGCLSLSLSLSLEMNFLSLDFSLEIFNRCIRGPHKFRDLFVVIIWKSSDRVYTKRNLF